MGKSKVRNYRLTGGFPGREDYLAFYPSGRVRIYMKDGTSMVSTAYSLSWAEVAVRRGVWEEI